MSTITLYDLPSRGDCACWSLNPWKSTSLPASPKNFFRRLTLRLQQTARFLLNYKSLPYKTEWTEYPDIAPKFKALYLPLAPHPPPSAVPFHPY
jgi:hypothetical protein